MRKKVLTIIVVLMFASVCMLIAGGNQEESEEKKVTIGFIQKTVSNPYFASLGDSMKKEVEARGWKYIGLDSNMDANEQQKNIETLLSQKVDAIIIDPADERSPIVPLKEALKQNILTISVNSTLEDPSALVTMVESSNLMNGFETGKYGASTFSPDEKITCVLMSGQKGATVGSADRRWGLFSGIIAQRTGMNTEDAIKAGIALEQELIKNGRASLPAANLEVRGQGWAFWNAEEGMRVMEDLLVAHPDINLVLGENDDMLLGAMKAIENAGKTKQIKIVAAADGQKEALEEIMKPGSMYLCTGVNNPPILAAKVVEILEDIIVNGKNPDSYEDHTLTPPICINKDNVNQYYDPNALF